MRLTFLIVSIAIFLLVVAFKLRSTDSIKSTSPDQDNPSLAEEVRNEENRSKDISAGPRTEVPPKEAEPTKSSSSATLSESDIIALINSIESPLSQSKRNDLIRFLTISTLQVDRPPEALQIEIVKNISSLRDAHADTWAHIEKTILRLQGNEELERLTEPLLKVAAAMDPSLSPTIKEVALQRLLKKLHAVPSPSNSVSIQELQLVYVNASGPTDKNPIEDLKRILSKEEIDLLNRAVPTR